MSGVAVRESVDLYRLVDRYKNLGEKDPRVICEKVVAALGDDLLVAFGRDHLCHVCRLKRQAAEKKRLKRRLYCSECGMPLQGNQLILCGSSSCKKKRTRRTNPESYKKWQARRNRRKAERRRERMSALKERARELGLSDEERRDITERVCGEGKRALADIRLSQIELVIEALEEAS